MAIDLTEGHLPLYTFSDPAPSVYTQSPAARQAALERTNLERVKAAKDRGDAQPPTPVSSPIFPTKLPDSLAITVAPSIVNAKRSELCDTILSTVPDNDKADSLRALCHGDGCRLLRHIFTESANVSVKVSGAIDREMLNLFNAGLAEPTLACFNRWKKDYKAWNEANTTNVLPNTIMAARYAAVVRKLGGKVEMDLDTEIKIAGAQGDVAKTIQCIETVLTDREADDVANGRGAAAAAKFDPRKSEFREADQMELGHAAVPQSRSRGLRR